MERIGKRPHRGRRIDGHGRLKEVFYLRRACLRARYLTVDEDHPIEEAEREDPARLRERSLICAPFLTAMDACRTACCAWSTHRAVYES